jgi:XapX domain-containing protein
MKMYLLSLGAGILVGVIYSLINVRSPAPPVVALVGLLGILLGEQAVPLLRQSFGTAPAAAAVTLRQCGEHVFGCLPGRGHGAADPQTPGDNP